MLVLDATCSRKLRLCLLRFCGVDTLPFVAVMKEGERWRCRGIRSAGHSETSLAGPLSEREWLCKEFCLVPGLYPLA